MTKVNEFNSVVINLRSTDQALITDENGVTVRLGIAYSDDPLSMVKEGDGLFRSDRWGT